MLMSATERRAKGGKAGEGERGATTTPSTRAQISKEDCVSHCIFDGHCEWFEIPGVPHGRRVRGVPRSGQDRRQRYQRHESSSDIQGRLRVTLYIRRSLRMVREIPGVPHGYSLCVPLCLCPFLRAVTRSKFRQQGRASMASKGRGKKGHNSHHPYGVDLYPRIRGTRGSY